MAGLSCDEDLIVADGKTKEILADAKLLEVHGLEKPYEKVGE